MSSLEFKIATPERVVFEAPAVESISLPTKMGEITILPNHIPLVSALVSGEVRVKIAEEEVIMAVSGGFIQVEGNKVVVLADTAERAEEINVERAEEARERAREYMKESKVTEETEYTALAGKLERELARLRVARKHREKRTPGPHISE